MSSDLRTGDKGRFQCPFCRSYEVTRLFIAPLNLDSCECAACRARWEEETGGGEYRGRAERTSVLMPPRRY